jgi:hypothetical protein
MKGIKSLGLAAVLLTAIHSPAFAVDTTQVYSSGILVLAFLGFCALIVVVQLIPAIILLIGTVKSMAKNFSSKGKAHAKAKY